MTDPTNARDRLAAHLLDFPPGADAFADDVRELVELLTPGVHELALERRRQITGEGFDPENDRGRSTQLFDAAGEYATAASVAVLSPSAAKLPVPFGWTLAAGSWKPDRDAVKNARRAGALLAAGIDALLAEQADTKAAAE